ncbi:MAG: tetratricopeptide repeat protein [Phycisphaerales bacterium]|nr:tetratricopeptide repeat protein [Phycisphaerales bacterium]
MIIQHPRVERDHRGGWILIFTVALCVRLVYLYEIRDFILFDHLIGDAAGYDAWGQRIAGGQWRPAEPFYQAPLYPYFMGCAYRLIGHRPDWLRVIQCVMGSASCIMVGVAARHWFGFRAGCVAGMVAALYSPAIYFDGIVQKATLTFALMSALLLLVSRTSARCAGWHGAGVGVVAALLALIRENALILLPILLIWTFVRPAAGRWKRVGTVACGAAIPFAPVVAHNVAAGGGWTLTTVQMGPNFYMGNHRGADGRYHALVPGRETYEYERIDAIRLAEGAVGRSLAPDEVSGYWFDRALDDIRAEPAAWLGLMWRKWWLVWNRYENPDTESYYVYREQSALLRGLGCIFHFGTMVPFAAAGAVMTWHRRRELALPYAIGLAIAAAISVFYVFGRYRHPLAPVVMLFAGAGLAEMWIAVAGRSFRRVAYAVAAGLAVAAIVNWPINPERELNAGMLGNLGAVLAANGRLDDAMDCFERAVEDHPDAPRLRQFLADAMSLSGRYREAIPHYRAALRLDPDWPIADFNLAFALEQCDLRQPALDHYRRALERNPADSAAQEAVNRLTRDTR